MCTAGLIGWDPATPPPPPAFGLIYKGAIGQWSSKIDHISLWPPGDWSTSAPYGLCNDDLIFWYKNFFAIPWRWHPGRGSRCEWPPWAGLPTEPAHFYHGIRISKRRPCLNSFAVVFGISYYTLSGNKAKVAACFSHLLSSLCVTGRDYLYD
jgi:hypothetical protein